MGMTISNGTVKVRDAVADAVVDKVDVGSGTAKLQAWSGSKPATPDTAPGGTKLAEWSYPNPAFGSSSSGTATISSPPADVTGLANGTIGFVRMLDRNGAGVWDDDDCGTTGTGHAVEFNTLTVSSGLTVSITAHTVTAPAS